MPLLADRRVYNQTAGRPVGRLLMPAVARLCLLGLIEKVRSEWLQAALSISNPNGRVAAAIDMRERGGTNG